MLFSSVEASYTDTSRAKDVGQVQKVTRAESPGYLPMGKTEKTRTSPKAHMFPLLTYCWPCGLDSLTFHIWSCSLDSPLTSHSLVCC